MKSYSLEKSSDKDLTLEDLIRNPIYRKFSKIAYEVGGKLSSQNVRMDF
ncbi:MAG: hypothetical protein J7L45_03370 [Candidatus Aenigmarchaeota archaeon]|nr:hypothetical protein [Candidatus Aenigmarchaeota archaeon]